MAIQLFESFQSEIYWAVKAHTFRFGGIPESFQRL